MPDFDAMTLDELVEWRVARKSDIVAIQDEIRSSNEAYHSKVAVANHAAMLRRMGLPEGTQIIVPASAEMAAEGQ